MLLVRVGIFEVVGALVVLHLSLHGINEDRDDPTEIVGTQVPLIVSDKEVVTLLAERGIRDAHILCGCLWISVDEGEHLGETVQERGKRYDMYSTLAVGGNHEGHILDEIERSDLFNVRRFIGGTVQFTRIGLEEGYLPRIRTHQ